MDRVGGGAGGEGVDLWRGGTGDTFADRMVGGRGGGFMGTLMIVAKTTLFTLGVPRFFHRAGPAKRLACLITGPGGSVWVSYPAAWVVDQHTSCSCRSGREPRPGQSIN